MKNFSHKPLRLCVSAASGSGGKTLLSLGLGRTFSNLGIVVQPFKKGPDYIDAAWLSAACRNAASNLDPFFQDSAGLRKTFNAALARSACPGHPSLALVEGNRGLYDGLDEMGSYSTAAIARILDLPILLCLNATKTTRTLAAILQGLINFEKGLDFCGIILNNTGSARHEEALKKAISSNVDLPILGCLPRLKENLLPERHMGLATFNAALGEKEDRVFERLASFIKDHCDIDRILECAGERLKSPGTFTDALEIQESIKNKTQTGIKSQNSPASPPPVIGIARDAAFWFYYPENIEALARAGAETREVSILDAWKPELWQDLSGLYLGGGFPEDYASVIASSQALQFISERARAGMPIYAECGGLILLGRSLETHGRSWPMAGVFDVSLTLCERPQGLGYVEGAIARQNPFFPKGQIIRAHEFHYTKCSSMEGEPATALELTRGAGLASSMAGRDGLVYKNVWASYAHIFAPALPCWAAAFLKAAKKWQKEALCAAALNSIEI